MTTSEAKFWKTFAKIAGRFRVRVDGRIRARGTCPVCGVANEFTHSAWKLLYLLAAAEIGLRTQFANDVADAADFTGPRPTAKLRAKMLAMMEAARAT